MSPGCFICSKSRVQRSEATDGAFDITVGPLMKSWGFFRGRGRLPYACGTRQVFKRVGYQHIKLDAGRRTIRFDESGVEIDLGGIAKGYAVDRAVDMLRSNGITSALVSSGTSSIYALGSPPGSTRGGKLPLRYPYERAQAGGLSPSAKLVASTSGNYEKFFKIEGKNYCHIMNPHTGWPVEGRLSAAVLAATGTDTDGRSAGCFVMGVERDAEVPGAGSQPRSDLLPASRGAAEIPAGGTAFSLLPDSRRQHRGHKKVARYSRAAL